MYVLNPVLIWPASVSDSHAATEKFFVLVIGLVDKATCLYIDQVFSVGNLQPRQSKFNTRKEYEYYTNTQESQF